MNRTAAVLVGLALSASLSACADDDSTSTSSVSDTAAATPSADPSASAAGGSSGSDDGADGPGGSPSPSASAASPASEPVPTATATPSPAAPADEGAPVGFPAGVGPVEQAPSGGPLSVTAVRVAPQDGYDRVVFELAGRSPGRPGWRVQYVDDPASQGSGEPVELDGAAALHISISGTGYPMDTGVEEYSGEPGLPGGLGRVRDLDLGAVFEGEYEAFVGVSEQAPFRVFRLSDPTRVVVDIRTG